MSAVPSLLLDSSMAPPGRAFEAYQATLRYYTLTLGPGVTAETFAFRAAAWQLEDIILSSVSASAVSVSRTPEHIRADGTDNYSFFAFTRGSWIGDFEGRPLTVGAGQIVGFDLSRPFEARATDHHALALAVARGSLVKQLGKSADIQGRIFDGPGAGLLLDHMVSLERLAPTMRDVDIPLAVKATMAIISALLTTLPKSEEIEPGALAIRHHIQQYIEKHIHDPSLDPERVAKEAGVARATLFRAFQPIGGVAAYILRRRLEIIRVLLLNPEETRSIGELASTFGFTNPSHFASAFKKAFGRSARETRDMLKPGGDPGDAVDGDGVPTAYREWKRRLLLR